MVKRIRSLIDHEEYEVIRMVQHDDWNQRFVDYYVVMGREGICMIHRESCEIIELCECVKQRMVCRCEEKRYELLNRKGRFKKNFSDFLID